MCNSADQRSVPLRVEGLAVGYDDVAVVAGVDLCASAGTCTVLVGANGSGKSTLLRVLAGLVPAQSGTVLVNGGRLDALSPRSLARRLAHLPQSPLVPDGVTVRELVLLGRHPHRRLLGGPTVADADAVGWAMAATGVEPFADRLVAQLSGGERQRVWVAVALAQQAPLLLLDEPTTFLDIRHQLELLELLRDLATDHGLTVVAVLHELNHAAVFADQLVLLGNGGVLAQGAPAEVLDGSTVRAAFGVDADVERRGDAVVCHFRTLDRGSRVPPAPPIPTGDISRAQALHPPAADGRRAGRRVRQRPGRRDQLRVGR